MASAAEERILLTDGHKVKPAQLQGSSTDAFLGNKLIFCKPKWLSDEQVSQCPLCSCSFSAMRRKHHCRQCGLIFCHNCCQNKILLPYLGHNDPERVCETCKPYIQVLLMACSKDLGMRCEAAQAWMEMCKHAQGVKEVVESGGVQTMVYMCREKELRLRSQILASFHSLGAYSALHGFLIDIGIIKALCRILTDSANTQSTVVMDALNLLLLFCRNPDLRGEVVEDGAVGTVLQYAWQTDRPASQLALQCINSLGENDKACDIIVNCQDKHYLSKLLALTKHNDDKIQELSLRILANISGGADYHRQRILQEEVFSGGSLAAVIINKPNNIQSLINITCLMANLAVTQNTQGGLLDHLQGMCTLMRDYPDHITMMENVGRGLANFTRFKHNCDLLKEHYPLVVSIFLCSSDCRLKQRGFQISLALLDFCPQDCVPVLNRDTLGSSEFLHCLSERKEALKALQCGVQDRLPEVTRPL